MIKKLKIKTPKTEEEINKKLKSLERSIRIFNYIEIVLFIALVASIVATWFISAIAGAYAMLYLLVLYTFTDMTIDYFIIKSEILYNRLLVLKSMKGGVDEG